jgi:hypothetical protein
VLPRVVGGAAHNLPSQPGSAWRPVASSVGMGLDRVIARQVVGDVAEEGVIVVTRLSSSRLSDRRPGAIPTTGLPSSHKPTRRAPQPMRRLPGEPAAKAIERACLTGELPLALADETHPRLRQRVRVRSDRTRICAGPFHGLDGTSRPEDRYEANS